MADGLTAMKRTAGVMIIVFSLAILAWSALFGTNIDGRDPPSSQCSRSTPPDQGGPFYEQTKVEGYRTYLPLGMVCTYDVDGDAFGPQDVVHQNWPATVIAVISLGLVGFGVSLFFKRTDRWIATPEEIRRRAKPKPRPRQETDEERARRSANEFLAAGESWAARWLYFGKTREEALAAFRESRPGREPGEYDEALARGALSARRWRTRLEQDRADLIAGTEVEDVLNAVFTLEFFNNRYAYRDKYSFNIQNIDVLAALAPRFGVEAVQAALVEVRAAIGQGVTFSFRRGEHEANLAKMQESFPGLSAEHLTEAIDYGYFANR